MSHITVLTPPLQPAYLTPNRSSSVPTCREHAVLFMVLFPSHRADLVGWRVALCQLEVPLGAL